MKTTVLRSRFLDGLKKVQNVVESKVTMPILQNVLLKAENGSMELTASDIDMTVKTAVECETLEAGATTLPVKMLFGTISKAAEGPVEIEVDENENATILASSAKFNLSGMKAADYPKLPELGEAKMLELDAITLKEMLRKTTFATATDDTRRPLMGVLMRFRGGKLTMAATDGRRLAMVEKEMEMAPESETELVLPARAAQELSRMLDSDGRVSITVQGSQARFSIDGTDIYTKLIDEQYPNFEQVIPRDLAESITVDRTLLIDALERASIVSVAASISTKFVFEEGKLTVSASAMDYGSAKDQLPVKYSGEKIEINFNPVYILEALRTIDDDEVKIELKDGHHPAVIRCSIPYIYVIMPLRVTQ